MRTSLLTASAAMAAAAQGKRACETDRDLPAICLQWSQFMVSAQNGDRAAYRRLLTEISDWARHWGCRYGIHGPACEELVCSVLRTLHRVRHTYQPTQPFMPWLLAVLRHAARKQGCHIRDAFVI